MKKTVMTYHDQLHLIKKEIDKGTFSKKSAFIRFWEVEKDLWKFYKQPFNPLLIPDIFKGWVHMKDSGIYTDGKYGFDPTHERIGLFDFTDHEFVVLHDCGAINCVGDLINDLVRMDIKIDWNTPNAIVRKMLLL